MSNYMYRPPVIDSIIPFLSNTEYGRLLSTCKEIKTEFDRKSEWKRRSPDSIYPKRQSLIKDALKKNSAISLLNEVTNKENLMVLLNAYRNIIPNKKLLDIYYYYLHSEEAFWHNIIRYERIQISFNNGSKMKPRKRKRFSQTPPNYIHTQVQRLKLCR